jgi:hypothetical protein
MCLRFDVVYSRCWYRPAVRQALLAYIPVTLQDAYTNNIPLTAIATLVSALSTLMLLPAFIAMVITVA